MSVYINPIGVATAAAVNTIPFMAIFKERLCNGICNNSDIATQVNVSYEVGTATLKGTTVFVPITATISVIYSNCNSNAITKSYSERFVLAFQGQTALPTSVTLTRNGQYNQFLDVRCGKAYRINVNDSVLAILTT